MLLILWVRKLCLEKLVALLKTISACVTKHNWNQVVDSRPMFPQPLDYFFSLLPPSDLLSLHPTSFRHKSHVRKDFPNQTLFLPFNDAHISLLFGSWQVWTGWWQTYTPVTRLLKKPLIRMVMLVDVFESQRKLIPQGNWERLLTGTLLYMNLFCSVV